MVSKRIFLIYVVLYLSSLIFALPNVGDFIYYNEGTTTNKQNYILASITNIYNEGYQYKDHFLGSNNWHENSPLNYLFEIYANQTIGKPSNGMRSSVPLGTFGQGIFELRGDGRLTDFTIFNNAPNAEPSDFSHKYDLNDAVFGFKFNTKYGISSKILQTKPYDENMVFYVYIYLFI